MGFLNNLWDDTLAGPAPAAESGLSRLRKFESFSGSRSSPMTLDHVPPVSRSITVLRNNPAFRSLLDAGSSAPSSPSEASTPGSPFSPAGGSLFSPAGMARGNGKKLVRRKSTSEALQRAEPRSPTVYDWIVISALDR